MVVGILVHVCVSLLCEGSADQGGVQVVALCYAVVTR